MKKKNVQFDRENVNKLFNVRSVVKWKNNLITYRLL